MGQWGARLTSAESLFASWGSLCRMCREVQSCRTADATSAEAQQASNSNQSMPSHIALPRRQKNTSKNLDNTKMPILH
ncbi:hypothetical protein GE21DRAFT_1284356 [Neurospora crassa]|nr:hypothetical protein GE21DRAFT_1284356 [Neurospora crassa]